MIGVIKVGFFVLRLLIALGALAVLAGTLAVFLVENFIELIKGGVGVMTSVVTLFASGFQKSTEAPAPSVVFSPLLAGVAITFLSIFASVFMPGQKIFLHIVAVMALAAGAWDVHRSATTPNREIAFSARSGAVVYLLRDLPATCVMASGGTADQRS